MPVLANIIGPELLIVLAIVALLFGGSRLPHLARSLGSAKGEFETGPARRCRQGRRRALMATDRLGTLPTIVLALVVPLVALVTVVVTLNVTDDDTSAASSARSAAEARPAPRCRSRTSSTRPIRSSWTAGAEITVTNDDGTVHTLTADDGEFDTGDLDGGASGDDHRRSHPGTLRVLLRHPQLHDRHDRGAMSRRHAGDRALERRPVCRGTVRSAPSRSS